MDCAINGRTQNVDSDPDFGNLNEIDVEATMKKQIDLENVGSSDPWCQIYEHMVKCVEVP